MLLIKIRKINSIYFKLLYLFTDNSKFTTHLLWHILLFSAIKNLFCNTLISLNEFIYIFSS